MKRKQGISLVVLVITIIVMIILAASVIISLSNTEIISQANNAVGATNLQQVQDLASLAWADAYMDGARTQEELQAAVDALPAEVVSKYDIVVTETGVTVSEKKVMIKFTIEGAEYLAEEGMSYAEWVASEYNTLGGITVDNETDYIKKDGSTDTLRDKNNENVTYMHVYGNSVIVDGFETMWSSQKPSQIPT